MSHVITCPSGLTGRIRGMKVREERVLADRKLAKSGGQVDALLGACWEETLDPGPYDFGEKDIDWGAVLQGDRFFALLQVRALTYGPTYAFALGCQNEGCRARFEWELDLTELPVRPLTAANNFIVIRHFAINLLRAVKDRKYSIKRSRRICDYNPGYRETLLARAWS